MPPREPFGREQNPAQSAELNSIVLLQARRRTFLNDADYAERTLHLYFLRWVRISWRRLDFGHAIGKNRANSIFVRRYGTRIKTILN